MGSIFICLLYGAILFMVPVKSFQMTGASNSFARFPKWNACVNASISFEFRTNKADSLLMYTDDKGKNVTNNFFMITLDKGSVSLIYKIDDKMDGSVEIKLGSGMNDNQWHNVKIQRNRLETTLTVDKLSESRISVDEDIHFAHIPENNDVFFGGLPREHFKTNLRYLALPSAMFKNIFRGEFRNVLYVNCTCKPVRGEMLASNGVDNSKPEACEKRNPCGDSLCISSDRGSQCKVVDTGCGSDFGLSFYYLPMDEIKNNILQNPSGLDATVYGQPRTVKGAKGNALQINGQNQHLKVSGKRHRRECLGDLELCFEGYTMGMWLKFSNPGISEGVYLSNGGHDPESHGIAMTYQNGKIKFIFRSKTGNYWTVSNDNVLADKWYHVTVSWSENRGLFLYLNGDLVGTRNLPQRRAAVRGVIRYNNFIIGRSNDNTGVANLGQITVDEFRFWPKLLSQKQIQENGPMYRYYLNMDRVAGQELIVENAETEINGDISLVDGKIGKAVQFSGRGEYIDLGNLENTCLGDPIRCMYGFTLAFWIKPETLPATKTYYFSSSAHGFNVYSEKNNMYSEVRSGNKVWRDTFYGLEVGKWHFVELTWNPVKGTEMFLDLKRASFQRRHSSEGTPTSTENKFFIGRSHGNQRYETNPSVILDEVEMFYGDRQSLLDLDLIQRGKPNKYHFGLDSMSGDIVVHPSLMIDTYKKPKLVKGKIGKAVKLNGQSQVVDFGEHENDCLGNLDLCHHGALLALWFKPTNFEHNMYFLSNGHNGITVTNQGNDVIITASTTTKKWEIITDKVRTHKWYFMEISWDPEKGLEFYINNKLVESDYAASRRTDPIPTDLVGRAVEDKFYLGRGNVYMERDTYGKGVFDELEYWYGPRDYLKAFGYLKRGKPERFIIPFESRDGTTIPHSRLNLVLNGNPSLVQGRIGNGLSLFGNGQYLDLGEHPNECLGNLALCPNGITISAWMNFQNLNDNMYILSTGNNGIRMYIKDDKLNVKVNQKNKEWYVHVPESYIGTWNYVELSWHPDFGLGLYLNNTLVAHSTFVDSVNNAPLTTTRPHVLLGKANPGDSTDVTRTADMVVDEMEVWYGRREELLAFDYILRDNIRHEIFSMETETNGIVDHPKYTVTLENGARLVPGNIGNAVSLSGYGQYVDIGIHNDKCMANLDKCKHGLTISMWLKARRLDDNTYFLSSPTYSLFYRDGRLQARFKHKGKVWEVFTPNIKPDRWHNVDLSWTPENGLDLYVDGNREASTTRYREAMQGDQPASEGVQIGKSDISSRTLEGDIDEVQFWYGPRDQLVASGQLGGVVNHQAIMFERVIRQFNNGTSAIVTPSRTIYLIGGPTRAQGDQHGAIRVNGKSQYIYVGDNVICTGNLDNCPHGFTMRFAMKPEGLINNMYFLDSFPLSIYYRDGKLFATARTPTKSWTVSAPEIRENEWQDIEITWYPQAGLTMTLNGNEAAHQTYGTPQDEVREWSNKLYLGRSLSDMIRERYANAVFERLDIWNARKQYLETHKIIRTDRNGGAPVVPDIRRTPAPDIIVRPPATRAPTIVIRPPVVTRAPTVTRETVVIDDIRPPIIVNPIQPDRNRIINTGDTNVTVITANNRELTIRLDGKVGIVPRRRNPDVVTTQRTVINPGGSSGGRTFFSGYDVTDFDKYFSNIVRFHGNAYIHYDFDKVGYQQQDILTPVRNETFTFQFITSENNGLIWLDDRTDLRMYLAIKDGYLMFYIDEGNGQVQTIKLNSRRIKELNDWEWHTFKMQRFGKELRFYIDEEYIGQLTTIREIQLIGRGDVYLGGTPIDYTDSIVTQSYNGGITKILYVKQSPNLLLRVSLMQYITQIHGGSSGSGIDIIVPGEAITPRPTRPVIVTRPPITQPPIITVPPRQQIIKLLETLSFIKVGFHLKIKGFLDIRSGGSVSFRFRTLERKGVLFFTHRQGSTNQLFLAFEIYDGKLYFISDFGARTRRLLISDTIVNDGTWQNIKLEFMDRKLFISLNGIQRTLDLSREEMVQAYFNDGIYIGGYPKGFKSWYIWSEQYDEYMGCFSDLQLQNIGTDMRGPVTSIPVGNYISQGCVDMNRQCVSQSPCRNGLCINGVGRYFCDCAGTEYAGSLCNDFAVIGGFQGNEYITYYYTTTQETHTNDISLRFKSFLRNAFLFQTVSSSSTDFLRGELDNGRIKVTIKVEGQPPQVFYVGSNLNDNMWHNLFIKRRGAHLELFVDSERPVQNTIQGENFYLRFDKIYFGGVSDSGVSLTDVHPNYLGLMQSVYWDKLDLFGQLKELPSSAIKIIWITNEGQMNRFNFRPVTYATREVFSQLSPLYMGLTMRLMLNFRTKEDSGIILFSKGSGSKFIAVEIVDGYVNFHFNNGYSTKSEIMRTPIKVNNNEWHMFEVREFEQGGRKYYKVTVDRTSKDIQIPGDQRLDLTGNLYIGGLSSNMFKDVTISSVLKSRHGFMGCLASVDLNGQSPDLLSSASNRESVLSSCTDIQVCPANACSNGGICLPGVSSHRCICDLTGYYGDRCLDYPIGVYFNRELQDKLFGVIKYRLNGANSEKDEIAFGFMTYEKDGILMRIDSGGANEFIELRLVDGFFVAEYDTGSGLQRIRFDSQRYNDGLYHVVQFTRTADGGFLTIDGIQSTIAHQVDKENPSHSVFDQVQYVYIGGRLDASNNIMNPFSGIIGGAYYNQHRFIDLGESASGASWIGDYYIITTGRPGYILVKKVKPTAPPRIPIPPEGGPHPIPSDIGGGGVVVPGASGGGNVVPPDGTIGIGNPGSISGGGGGDVGPSGGGGPFTGALTGTGGGGGVPIVPAGAGGARAGAVMGAILGTMAFLASLMWAFWGLKPGVISLGGGGGGGAGGPPAMSISSPTATNLPVAQALGGGPGAGGGAGGAKVTVVNGGAGGGGSGTGGGGGGAGSGSAFTSYYTSSAATAGGAGGAGSGGAGYVAGGEGYGGGSGGGYGMSGAEYSSTTTRSVTGGAGGGGTGTGYGAGYGTGGQSSYSASRLYSSNTMGGQSAMDAGESTTADYDLASGTGTMMGGGGSSSNTMNKYSTMQSSYQVQNVRTVLVNNQGTQQLVTYHSASGAVTPGAAGDEVRVDCCLMNEDGRTVVTGSTLGPPQVWNMQTGELLRIMKGDTVGSTNLHLACNDRLLVGAVHADLEINEFSTRKGVTVKKLQIWDFVTGKPLDMGVDETCSALCVMSDPDKVVFGRSDKFGNATSIIVWDLLGNQPIKEMRYDAPVGNNDYINFLALSQNDRYCVAGFTNSFDNFAEFVVFDMTLTSFNINDANILRLDANPECTAILPHEEACTGLRNGDLVIWKLRSGEADRQLLASGGHAHSREVKAVTLSQDSKYLVSASADNTMKIWDMATEKPIQTLSGHTDEVWCSAISADNEIIVSGSRDGTIRLWRCKNGSEICAFNTGVDVFNVTMSQDKGTIVALGDKFGARKLIMLQVVRTKIRRQTTS